MSDPEHRKALEEILATEPDPVIRRELRQFAEEDEAEDVADEDAGPVDEAAAARVRAWMKRKAVEKLRGG